MIPSTPLDDLPLWLLLILTIAGVFLAVEAGYQLGGVRRRHSPEKDAPVGAMVGAMLGLLAFLLAFTFGLAATRFDERRHTILDEANAIGTTYLRAGLLPEPARTRSQQLLRQYVDARLLAVEPGKLEEAVAQSVLLHQQLWAQAGSAMAADDHSIAAGLFVSSLNRLIDMHSTRVMVGVRSRIPATIWAALYFVAALTMATMGYHEGLTGTRRSLASLTLVIAFSLILLLIIDLDRPLEGLLRASQQAVLDLRGTMDVGGQ